ncbi:RidA family protein [Amycolatopsis sp. Poz14]|uniref:RidA family protein n=1 Tax=Amycolatopsis sp. Poz14 TaxID=1447705 RepID=UPI001EE86079|nr:RidA family protein [Amycolatopsis sp. Poz14]MCG3754075.1 RidA family protein [Amycolatopsis sp. Poz14]
MTAFLTDDPAAADRFGLSGAAIAGGYVFAGGMALDMDTFGRLPGTDTVAAETRVVLDQIRDVVEGASGAPSGVLKATCYVSAAEHIPEMLAAFDEYFAGGPLPIRSVAVVGIAGACRVEIDVIATAGAN